MSYIAVTVDFHCAKDRKITASSRGLDSDISNRPEETALLIEYTNDIWWLGKNNPDRFGACGFVFGQAGAL
jgi:hypothetical protein